MRVVGWPMYLVCAGQLGIFDDLRFRGALDARSFERGLQNVWMRAATAKISGARVFDVGFGRVGVSLEQPRYAHEKTRRAITALQRVLLDERLLQLAQALVP